MADDIDFEDWDDSDLNFDDFNASTEDPGNDRTAVSVLPESIIDGVKSKSTDTRFIGNVIKESMPTGYRKTLDKADEIAGEVSTVYNETQASLKPAFDDFKRASKKHLPKVQKILPESVFKRLEGILTTEEDKSLSAVNDTRDQQIGMEVSKIFNAQAVIAEQNREEQTLQNIVAEERERTRHEAMMDQGDRTKGALERLVSYQDEVLARYQQKHLDLEFRQYFTLSDILETTRAGYTDVITSLKAITKNTALPEAVKQQLSEQYGQLTRDRLLGNVNDAISDRVSSIFSNTLTNLKGKAGELTSSISDGLGSFTDILDQLSMADEMRESMGGSTESGAVAASEFGGGLVGSALAARLGRAGLGKVANRLKQNDTFMEGSYRLEYLLENLPTLLNEYGRTTSGKEGFLGTLDNFLRENVATTGGETTTILQNLKDSATETASFDVMTRRSIIDIIPGYLSRILQQVTMTNTGDLNTERVVYNVDREDFTSLSQASSDARENVFSSKDVETLGDRINEAVSKLDTEETLSEEARQVFGLQLIKDMEDGLSFKPLRYYEPHAFSQNVEPHIFEEIKSLISERYSVKDSEDGPTLGDGVTSRKRLVEDARAVSQLRSDVPLLQQSLNEYMGTGDKELLRLSGLVKSDSGKDEFDYSAHWERIYNAIAAKQATDEEVEELALSEPAPEEIDSEPTFMGKIRERFSSKPTSSEVPNQSTIQIPPVPLVSATNEIDVSSIVSALGNVGSKIDGTNVRLDKILETCFEDRQDSVSIEPLSYKDDFSETNTILNSILNEVSDLKALGNTAVTGIVAGDLLGGIGSGLGRAGSAVMSGLGKYYSAAGSMAKSVFTKTSDLGTKLGGTIKDTLFTKREGDIYVGGFTTPSIRLSDLKAGMYLDRETGEPILSFDALKDLKGEVVDRAGNIILSVEDVAKGLFLNDGTSLAADAWKWVKTKPLEYLTSYYGTVFDLSKKAFNLGKTGLNKLERKLNEVTDIYVKGESEPVLRKHLLEKGLYFDKETGDPIFSFDDIKGEVVDQLGNLVLSMDQWKLGLVDVNGKEIKFTKLLDKAIDYGMSGIMFAGKLGKRGMDKLKSIAGTAFDRASGLFGKIVDYFEDSAKGVFSSATLDTINVKANVANIMGAEEQIEIFRNLRTTMTDTTETISESVSQVQERTETLVERAEREVDAIKDKVAESETIQKVKDKVFDIKDAAPAAMDKLKDDVLESQTVKTLKEKFKEPKDTVKDLTNKVSEKLTGKSFKDNLDNVKDNTERLVDRATESFSYTAETIKGSMEDLQKGEIRFDTNDITDSIDRVVDLVKERLPVKDTVGGDSDGDGFRDGSYQAQRAKKGTDKDSSTDESSILAKLSEQLAKFKAGGKGSEEESGGNFLTDWIGDKVGGLKDKVFGKLGKVAKSGLGKVAAAGMGALKLGGSGLLAAAKGLGSGLLGAGKVALNLGRFAAGPVGIAAGLGYGAYKLGSYLAEGADAEPVESLRYAQYGIDDTNSDHLRAIRRLEDELYDDIEYDDQGNANLPNVDYEDLIEEHAEDFGLDPNVADDANKFLNWFGNTFRPVLLAHAAATNKIDEDVDLLDIDDEMDDEHKGPFVKTVYKTVRSMEGVRSSSPFKDSGLTDNVETIYDSLSKEHGIEDTEESSPEPTSAKTGPSLTTPKAPSTAKVAPVVKDAVSAMVNAPIERPTAMVENLAKAVHRPQEDVEREISESVVKSIEVRSSVNTDEGIKPLQRRAVMTDPEDDEPTTDDVMESVKKVKNFRVDSINAQKQETAFQQTTLAGQTADLLAKSVELQQSMDFSLRNIDLNVSQLVNKMEDENEGGFFDSDEDKREEERKRLQEAVAKFKANRSKPAPIRGSVSMKKTPI